MKHIEPTRFTGLSPFWRWLNLAVWMGLFLPGMLSAQQQTFTTNTTFVVPPGVTRLTVECWGGGGAGGESTGTSETGGGGGGAYARRNSLVVTPGETLNVFVGQGGVVGGAAGKGGDTYLARNINPLVVAIGGNNGSRNSQNGALGGSFAGSLGDVTYGGGNGANGSRDAFGGGGGSAAGSAANGVSAIGSTGALAPLGGGNGGNGALPGSAATAGQPYGGGGGGSLNIQSLSRPATGGANGIMLVYYSVSCIAPAISVQPLAATDLCSGASLNLSVTATGTPLNYQWKKNGNNLLGQTASSLQLAAVSANDAGSYTVTISNACGTITSSAAVVTVNNAPVITAQPAQTGPVCTGGTLNLSVSSNGSGLSYEWFNNGVSIPAATASTLSLSNVTQADAGDYTVTVSNACGSTTSNIASVNINGTVSIASQSSSLSTCQSQLIQLSVTPAGDLNSILNYDWFLNGVLQPSVTGSTTDFIADPSTAGTYTVAMRTCQCQPCNRYGETEILH